MIHLNLSTTANLGTEESGRSVDVAIMGRWGCNTTIFFRRVQHVFVPTSYIGNPIISSFHI